MRKINPNAKYVRMNNNGRLKKEYRGKIARVAEIDFDKSTIDECGLVKPIALLLDFGVDLFGDGKLTPFLSRHVKETLSAWCLPVLVWRLKNLF